MLAGLVAVMRAGRYCVPEILVQVELRLDQRLDVLFIFFCVVSTIVSIVEVLVAVG